MSVKVKGSAAGDENILFFLGEGDRLVLLVGDTRRLRGGAPSEPRRSLVGTGFRSGEGRVG